jgi:hypothetical protein
MKRITNYTEIKDINNLAKLYIKEKRNENLDFSWIIFLLFIIGSGYYLISSNDIEKNRFEQKLVRKSYK